jgi:histone H2A
MPKNLTNDYNFCRYIRAVLKQIHSDTGLTEQAVMDTNMMLHLVMENVLDVACELTHKDKSKTLSARAIESATKIVLPTELKSHALSTAQKALVKFSQSQRTEDPLRVEKRAGLKFPVARVEHLVRVHCPELKISEKACIYLTTVLEYMCAEIMELSGNVARDFKKKRITPHHISYAIQRDEELNEVFCGVTLNGSVLPHIRPDLLPRKKTAAL